MLKDDLGNIVAMYQVPTPLKARIHQPVQPNLAQPNLAFSDFGSTGMTLPPSRPPQIVDIIPGSGPYDKSQRVWLKVESLPRGNGLAYFVGFGGAGIVSTSFISSEEDEVQILECTTPMASTPCPSFLSLMHHYDPLMLLGSSNVYYEFTSQSS